MARAVGIPSRVAVGFLPGTKHGNVWSVTARESHAWPELYFSGYGWVRYEPTPSGVTGSAPSWSMPQAQTDQDPATSNAEPQQPAVTVRPTANTQQDRAQDHAAGTVATQTTNWAAVAGVAGGIVLLLALLASPAVIRVVRRRGRLGGSYSDPADRVEAGWAEVRDTVVDLGRRWPAGSPRSIAEAAGRYTDQPTRQALLRLAVLVERGRYARSFGDAAAAAGSAGLVRSIRSGLLADRSARSKLAMRVFPRSVFRRLK